MNEQRDEFSILARELLEFVNGRPFDVAYVEYVLFEGGARSIHGIQKDSVTVNDGPSSNRQLEKLAYRTARALVERASEDSGEKAWGLIFKIWPSGKFNVEFIYTKPDWLKEDDDEEDDTGLDNPLYGPKLDQEKIALTWLEDETAKETAAWGLGRETSWHIDVQNGEISWTFNDKKSKSAAIQILGTLKIDDGVFRWSWANSSIPAPLTKSASILRRWGEERGIAEFSDPAVTVDELRVWSWAAMAAQMSGARGAYRVKDNGLSIYLVFDNLK